MNVSSWSIKNPVPTIIFFILLCMAGLMSFNAMKRQNFPDLDLPFITVSATLPGASPSQLENEVARKLENAIVKLQDLKHIYTKIQDGNVLVTAEFRLEKPTQEALDDVRSAVSETRADLPNDLRDPIISKMNIAGTPILAFAVDAKSMDEEALSWFVDDVITRKLMRVRGIGSVNRVGGVNRQIWVELDSLKLQSLNASAADVSRQLKLIQLETTGGVTQLNGREQPIRTLATVDSADALAKIEIILSDGRKVRLEQVANVKDTIATKKTAAFLNGQPVVGFEVSRSKGASEVDVGKGVLQALSEIQQEYPDLKITESFNFVTPVLEEFDASMQLLLEGALLAVLVVWLFLKDIRATFVSSIALPLSVIPAFIGMHYYGFTINVVTLLALSLVVGILVDDAIVEVENIARHLRMGKTPYQAAMEATNEIGLAVIATTFTLIAVFLPTAFMSGIPGKFFKQFGWSASFAVFASLVVARMLTPMMAAYLMKPAVSGKEKDGRLMRGYMVLVKWCIAHRIITLFSAILFFAGSIYLIQFLPTGFIPSDDNSQTQVRIELPPGATLQQTIDSAESARMLLKPMSTIKNVYTTIGAGAAGSDPFAGGGITETRKATLTIILTARGSRPNKQLIEQEIRQRLKYLPGVRINVGLGGSGEKYALVLTGNDAALLQSTANAVEKDLRSIPGIGNVASTAALVRQEVVVKPNFSAAADLGVTTAAIGETLRIATVGDYEEALTKLNLESRQIPVVVKINESAKTDISVLEKLAVPGVRGPVPLGQVATMQVASGPAIIDRYDRARNIELNVELSGVPLGEVTEAVKQLPSIKNLPAGITQTEMGDAETMNELFSSFGIAMFTGVVCIYFVLVLLFKDFLQPITILVALPLSLGGAFVALLLAEKALSMPSMIGLIMLMGITTKNSILLVEYAMMAKREQKMRSIDALLDACHKRARPIIMTTIAMMAGMLPIALAWSSGDGSFRSPMAIAVIGGLITSTFLSLLVIPAIFTYVDDFSNFIFRRKTTSQ
jgi:multidrug efflux pump subunit AcrB